MNRALVRLIAAHGDAEKIFMHDWFLAQTAAALGMHTLCPQNNEDWIAPLEALLVS